MNTRVIHLIDEDSASRQRMAFALHELGPAIHLHLCAESFLSEVHADTLGCLVAELNLPGMGGLELMKKLRGAGYDAPCLLVTRHGSMRVAVHAMQAGAAAVLEKPIDEAEFKRQVQRCFTAYQLSLQLRLRSSQVRRVLASLSSGESEVLHDLLAGKANKVVAYDLAISERTVEVRRAKIMKKLGVRSIAQLVRDVVVAQVEQDSGHPSY